MLEVNNYSSNILHDINFSLQEGENLIILGENGAGKSTLAKVISNLIENNNVKLFSKNISQLDDKKRAEYINYIPPKLEIFDEYITLREFLELSCVKSIDNTKIDEIIGLLKLEKLEHRFCKSFSSGEKQLLLLASSLLHDANITIFDELTANLDISRLKEVYEVFNSNRLKQKIIITHNLDLAYALKYKVLFIEDGRVKFFGEHSEFFSDENLATYYDNALSKVENHLVVKL